ncbi:MAG: GDP-mannose 4,6-dehydratase [Gammaproteobacteria bacterium]|nr:GDP-mannose 4,6-dehydratase [Gammaproteobacteria bacterium]MDH3465449.1 GDP-mannose 4,6-dehydratase [Gammaproteobacteria bacterium]
MKNKTALVTGITGQGGAYLSQLLINRGYKVVGTTRDSRLASLKGLEFLGIASDVEVLSLQYRNRRRVEDVIDGLRPDEIYHLASPSSVARSFVVPGETTEDIVMSTVNILDGIRRIDRDIRFFNAASIEMYGRSKSRINELSPLSPLSPYGVAKSATFLQTRNYREAYGVYACSGILSNFESPLRPASFVTSKIVSAASRIAAGDRNTLHLGNISIHRDWGFAQDHMDAAWKMLQQDNPEDFVIATGKSYSLEDFLNFAFEACGLDYRQHVTIDDSLLRPLDIEQSVGDPSRANQRLEWRAQHELRDVIEIMINAQKTEYELGTNSDSISESNVKIFPQR